MSDQTKETPVNGLLLIGKVNAKSMRQYKNGDEHFFLSIAAPGCEVMFRVEVKPHDWGTYQEGSIFKSKVNFNVFNNQVTFQPAQ